MIAYIGRAPIMQTTIFKYGGMPEVAEKEGKRW